jgi:hypothetical protein
MEGRGDKLGGKGPWDSYLLGGDICRLDNHWEESINQHFKLLYIYIYDYAFDFEEIILVFGIEIGITKKIISLNWEFDESSKSKPLVFLNQCLGPVYDDLPYNEDPLPSLPRINAT